MSNNNQSNGYNNNVQNTAHEQRNGLGATVQPLQTNNRHSSDSSTTINIETETNHYQEQQQQQDSSTRVNMEDHTPTTSAAAAGDISSRPSISVQRNILSFFNEARTQLGRQTSYPGTSSIEQRLQANAPRAAEAAHNFRHSNSVTSSPFSTTPHSPSTAAPRNIRTWRMNLNNVLSFSSAPSTEALRSLITHSGSFRYSPLNSNDGLANAGDNIHLLLNQNPAQSSEAVPASNMSLGSAFRVSSRSSRSNSLREEGNVSAGNNAASPTNSLHQLNANGSSTANDGLINSAAIPDTSNRPVEGVNIDTISRPQPSANINTNNNTHRIGQAPHGAEGDDEDNVISTIVVKVLSHFVRYLPFIGILLVKFIHDHLLGIFDLLLLHGIMYHLNKTLREQVAKFSQKSFAVLVRDFMLVVFVVAYRVVLSTSVPDPFGLLIAPPSESVTIDVASISKSGTNNYLDKQISHRAHTTPTIPIADNTVTIRNTISLGVLLYYVAINDLILKLLTILVKISVTMLPTKVIRLKPRARLYVLIEFISQFYRAFAPVHQWLRFLFESYSGLEVISGVLFSSLYMGAKGFEFVERGKSLKKALINFIRNTDYERKPTNDELDAAGTVCPICHDSYNAPIVLECGHIFCDDCVSTWFKREQTCPMCRAKVSEDPTWQDGSTTFFYQLC